MSPARRSRGVSGEARCHEPLKSAPSRRSGLFRKYALTLAVLIGATLLLASLGELVFTYRETEQALGHLQRQEARAAAREIERFIEDVENQITWAIQPSRAAGAEFRDKWRVDYSERRIDYLLLLRLAPAITELAYLDRDGRAPIRVSRLALDPPVDFSQSEEFQQARREGAVRGPVTIRGPVTFRDEYEPYMTIVMREETPGEGYTRARLNLSLLWDVVSRMRVGREGLAYVVDKNGLLIAHPDITHVLGGRTNLSDRPQVCQALKAAAARRQASGLSDRPPDCQAPEAASEAEQQRPIWGKNVEGRLVLSSHARIEPLSHARIEPLDWSVLVEQPPEEALEALSFAILRTAVVLAIGLLLAIGTGLILARRLVTPIRTLQAGAASIGAGNLNQRIEVRTGDELEDLAGEFNEMAARLSDSLASLEYRVEERTRELSEALERQTAISEILRIIAASPASRQKVLEAVAANAARLCEADGASIWLLDGDLLRRAVGYGSFAPLAGLSRPLSAESISGRAALERRTVHEPDLRRLDEKEYAASERRYLFRHGSAISTPVLLHDGQASAVISLGREQARAFTDRQIELLEVFADQIAIALESSRLFEQLDQRTRELAQSVEELQGLSEVSQAVSSTLDLQRVLDTVVEHAVQLSGADGGAIYEFEEQTEQLRLRATRAFGIDVTALVEADPLQLGEGVVGRAGLERRVIQVADIAEEGVYQGRLREPLLAEGFRSLIAVPLLVEGRLLGGLVVARKTPGSFEPRVVELLQTFASQSALAIQNARLYSELELANRHKSLFVANVSHELRTPLNAILGHTRNVLDLYLSDGDDRPIPRARIRDRLRRVLDNGEVLLALIEDILDLSRIEVGLLSLSRSEVSIAEIAKAVCVTMEPFATAKGLNLTLRSAPNLPSCWGDPVRIAQVFRILLDNAIKFTGEGEVGVEVGVAGSELLTAVRDTGPGVPESDHERIFEVFYQADSSTTRRRGGTGLGLAIARSIVKLHGGRIWVESLPGQGATFRFTLPIGAEHPAG